jgi:phytoene synthase
VTADKRLTLKDSYAYCEEVTGRAKTSFALAIRLLPGEKRRALHAIYAFCRVADDIADDGADPALLHDPRLTLALDDAVHRFAIPRKYFDEILEGTRMDAEVRRYESFDDLRRYCYHVASAVGLACLHVFGFEDASALKHAEELGIAMQLTNIVRDVKEDAERDRIYLPQEDLRQYGVDERDLFEGRVTEEIRDLLKFQVTRARLWFERGRRLLPHVDAKARRCPAAIAAVYQALLDRIEARDYDVFSRRVSLSAAQKLKVVAAALR